MNVGELSENVVWKCCLSLKITQSFFLKAVMQVHANWVIWAFLRAFCPQNKNIIIEFIVTVCMYSQGAYRKSKWNRTESVKMVSIHFFYLELHKLYIHLVCSVPLTREIKWNEFLCIGLHLNMWRYFFHRKYNSVYKYLLYHLQNCLIEPSS